jgi:hypothetical protein
MAKKAPQANVPSANVMYRKNALYNTPLLPAA